MGSYPFMRHSRVKGSVVHASVRRTASVPGFHVCSRGIVKASSYAPCFAQLGETIVPSVGVSSWI